eukprot:Seg3064.3 transcript_id=Seg3064.3/GoldUCD/mRNA.D3Y31 product="Zinc metalloproteinase nas-15" protein_id=Seg3064.3/GoldUCD/D3Y31
MMMFLVLFSVLALSMAKKHLKSDPIEFVQIQEIDGDIKSSIGTRNNNRKPALFEGDMVWTESLKYDVNSKEIGADQSMVFSDAINNKAWAGGVIPYAFGIHFNAKGQQVVKEAVAKFNKHTCIKWVPRAHETDYVAFFHGRGCYSYIGKRGGQQVISLGNPGCLHRGIAMHEMMHCAGFYHEQSRRDRDSHIKVHFGNVQSNMAHNFKKYRGGIATTLGAPYDKQSLMHYGNYAFSKNKQATITSLSDPDEKLGQRKKFSKIDIQQLNKYYNCKGKTSIIDPKKCVDKDEFCPSLKAYCHMAWVMADCVKTCTGCSGKEPSKKKPKGCADTSNECAAWKKQGYCKSKDMGYRNFMAAVCRKSCGLCR